MNTPVSFELAKLLREKEFDEPCYKGWDLSEEDTKPTFHEYTTKNKNSDCIETFYTAPTISEAVMWLYEKHDIWIQPYRSSDDGDGYPYFWCEINNKGKIIESTHFGGWFESPTEAYEAGITHVLENLI